MSATLFISDINKKFLKISFIYFCISLFLILFSAVYEYLSHGVYSYFMIYAFCIPLVFGAFAYFIKAVKANPSKLPSASDTLYSASIATFTVGSILKGVLDIYGTTNRNIIAYPIIGSAILIISAILALINKFNKNKEL